jgi:hypothetical protein
MSLISTSSVSSSIAQTAKPVTRFYRANYYTKYTQEDNYRHGVQIGTGNESGGRITICATSFADLVIKCKTMFGYEKPEDKYVFLTNYDDNGIEGVESFSFNQLETEDGSIPNEAEMNAFKNHGHTLYLVDYTFSFEIVEKVKMSMADLEGVIHNN